MHGPPAAACRLPGSLPQAPISPGLSTSYSPVRRGVLSVLACSWEVSLVLKNHMLNSKQSTLWPLKKSHSRKEKPLSAFLFHFTICFGTVSPCHAGCPETHHSAISASLVLEWQAWATRLLTCWALDNEFCTFFLPWDGLTGSVESWWEVRKGTVWEVEKAQRDSGHCANWFTLTFFIQDIEPPFYLTFGGTWAPNLPFSGIK